MIKKTITYKSLFEENEVTEDFWFHLSKADMLDLAVDESFESRIRKIMAAKDNVAIVREFKKIIESSVGQRNGEQFVKTPEYARAFMSSPAFDVLIMEIMTGSDQGTAFITGLLPSDMKDKAVKEIEKLAENKTAAPDPFANEPSWVIEQRVPTKAEFSAATPQQKLLAFQWQVQNGLASDEDLTGYKES